MSNIIQYRNLVYFVPNTISDYSNFIPLIKPLLSNGIIVKILIIKEFNNNNIIKLHNLDFNSKHVIKCSLNCLPNIEISNIKIGNKILVVGNDSEKLISKTIRFYKKIEFKIVLFQDGWLDWKNINKPIYRHDNLIYKLKKKIHILLVKKWMPTRRYFHNFIGQNSDYYFVYSEIAKQHFIKSNIDSEHIFIVGSPRHSVLREIKRDELNENIIVLFNTNPLSQKEMDNINKTISWVIDIFPDNKILIKTHPMDNPSNNSRYIINNNIFISNKPIIEILKTYNIKIALCFASTIIFDLFILNIPTIQLTTNYLSEIYTNYFYDLPIASSKEQLSFFKSNYDLVKNKENASKYLADINSNFNSIETSNNTLINLLKL